MKRTLTAGLACIISMALVTPALQAQSTSKGQHQPPSPEQRQEQAKKRMAEMAERLELTDEQKEQIKPILADNAQKMRALRDEMRSEERSEENMTKMRNAMQDLQKETRAQMASILDDDQMAEYEKIQAEMRQKRREAQGNHRPPS